MIYNLALLILALEVIIAIRCKGYLLAIMLPFLLAIPYTVKFSVGINLNIFNLSVLIVCLAYAKEFKTKRPLIQQLGHIVSVYCVYILVTSFFTEIGEYDFKYYLQNMILFFLEYTAMFLVLNHYTLQTKHIKFFDTLLCITIVAIMIYGFFCYMLGANPYMAYVSLVTDADIDMSNVFQDEVRGALKGRISGTFLHPLQYGQVCLLIFSYLAFQIKGKVWNGVYITVLVMLIISTVLTGSRSSIFPILLSLFFLFRSLSKQKMVTYLFLLVLSIIIVYPMLSSNIQKTVDAMVMVWNEKASDKADVNGSSIGGRSDQLTAAFSIVKDDILFGKGKGYVKTSGGKHPELYGYESIFLSEIVDGGIVGLLAFIIFYIMLYNILIKQCKHKWERLRVKALMLPFFVSISLTGISYCFFTFFAIFYMMTFYNIHTSNINQNNKNE